MPFSGKATFSAGSTLPELVEDLSDIVGIVSPFETALLDHLGDPVREAYSTVHEWMEDSLIPNRSVISDASITNGLTDTTIDVADSTIFRVGDLVRPGDGTEIVLVTAVDTALNRLTMTRGYGATVKVSLVNGMTMTIIGNAALEGATAEAARFTNRVRHSNYTQIFASTVEVSGTLQAVRSAGIEDELDYQKQQRTRELLRDLENTVINGVAHATSPTGSSTQRRSMNGLLASITSRRFVPGQGGIPAGDGAGSNGLTEAVLNAALKQIWDNSSAGVDTILVGGAQKRRINGFATALRGYDSAQTTYRDLISVYESDYGVCRVVMSRWVPPSKVILLDSTRLSVMPLRGRSFQLKPLAATGDSHIGQVIGEYTLELRNEDAHGVIDGLSTT